MRTQTPDLLTIEQAAHKTGKSPQSIRRWITSQKLPADKSTGVYLILPTDLDRCTNHVSDAWQLKEKIRHLEERVTRLEEQATRRKRRETSK